MFSHHFLLIPAHPPYRIIPLYRLNSSRWLFGLKSDVTIVFLDPDFL